MSQRFGSVDELCDALQRNDPTVTTCAVSIDLIHQEFENVSPRLGLALKDNTTVTELELEPWFYVDKAGAALGGRTVAPSATSDGADETLLKNENLFSWIGSSASLTKVGLQETIGSFDVQNVPRTQARVLFLQGTIQAMAKNPHIRSFEARLDMYERGRPFSMVTQYLQSENGSKLQSIGVGVCSDSPLYWDREPPPRTPRDVEELRALGKAIGALTQLEKLELRANVRHVLEGMLSFEQPFSTALTAMTFNFSNISWAHDWAKSPVALIPKTFGRLPNLKSVTIVRYTLDASSWTAIATGLQSNDSITELSLLDTDFTKEALDLFLVHMQSSDDDDTAASRQYIRRLTLNKHLDTRFERFVAIAHMFCRSLLQHIHVGLNVWYRLDEFFAILAATPPVHLRSLTISSRRGAVLPAIAPFVAATSTHVHLEELEIKIDNEHNDFSVPRVDTFVASLNRNGNLQRVKVAFADPQNNPLARHERLIQSISTRNRLFPRLVSTCFADTGSAAAAGTGSTNKDDTLVVATAVDKDDDDPVRDALPQDFPTLCLAAMRAESQMTPRWVLSGVQAAPADGDDALGQVELPNVGVGDVVGGGSGYSRSSRGKRKRDMSDPSE